MNFHLVVFASAVFSFASFADVTSRPPRLWPRPIDSARIQHQEGDAESDFQRGVQFAEGAGVEQDYSEAARFYRQAAQAGYAPAQYNLAYLYKQGLGVERDLKQAAIWYRKAADQGDAEAQNNLGTLYATGQGVRRNDAAAVRSYRWRQSRTIRKERATWEACTSLAGQ